MAKSTIEVLESKVQSMEKSKEVDIDRIKELKKEIQKTDQALNETKQELEKWKTEAKM